MLTISIPDTLWLDQNWQKLGALVLLIHYLVLWEIRSHFPLVGLRYYPHYGRKSFSIETVLFWFCIL